MPDDVSTKPVAYVVMVNYDWGNWDIEGIFVSRYLADLFVRDQKFDLPCKIEAWYIMDHLPNNGERILL